MVFDIDAPISMIGGTVTIKEVTVDSTTDRGDETISTTSYTIKGYIEEMDGSEDEVKSGIVVKGDIRLFVDEDESNVGYLQEKNRIVYNSTDYRIKNVIHNKGHYEVYASKIE